ncbi:MAG: class I SAM-dependent methyltransferase [Pseudomonadota bacterium]
MTKEVVHFYKTWAPELSRRFDDISSARLYAPLSEWLPNTPSRVLDVGAGTGRDARWFATLGHDVIAADPVPELRTAQEVAWVTAALPELDGLEGPFDLITLSGVWHHIAPGMRDAAMARLAALTATQGRCLISLREGPASNPGTTWPAPVPQTSALATGAGFTLSAIIATSPQQARNRDAGVRFTWLALTRQ